jgi:gas vesicle protein
MTNRKVILALLASFAAGAAVGMLLTPDKGSGTSKKICEKSEDLIDALNSRIEQKVNELLNAITGKVKQT